MEIVKLVPQPERDRASIQEMVKELEALVEAGEITELLYVGYAGDTRSRAKISGNMPVSRVALAVAFLQSDLSELIQHMGSVT